MTALSEPLLIVVGIGAMAFMLAVSSILTGEARRTLELHFVQVQAANLRNDHARQILALKRDPGRHHAEPAPGRTSAPGSA